MPSAPGRIVALAAVAVLLLAGGAYVLRAQSPEGSIEGASGGTHVTLYQNGIAFVERNVTFASPGGATTLTMSVPASARLGSLAFSGPAGVAVQQVRAPLHGSGTLQAGDRLVVHVSDGGPFEGTLLRDEGTLQLATGDGTIMIPRDKVVAIELVGGAGGNATTPGEVEVEIRLDAPAGTHDLRMSYLAQGAGWTPGYRLDLDTGDLEFLATLTGLAGWKGVTLDLVSGSPHLAPGGPTFPQPFALEARSVGVMADAARADGFGPSEALGPLHRFRHPRSVDLPAGEQVRLVVLRGEVGLSEPLHEAETFVGPGGYGDATRPVPVRERVELTNTLHETLPEGILLAYRDGAWVGEDRLAATPPGGRSNVTLALVEDVTARLVREAADFDNGSTRETFALHVENRADEPVTLRASVAYPTERSRFVSADPQPDERLGGRVAWTDGLATGATATYRLTVETQSERAAAPMPMEGAVSREPVSSGAAPNAPATAAPAPDAPAPAVSGPSAPAKPMG